MLDLLSPPRLLERAYPGSGAAGIEASAWAMKSSKNALDSSWV